MPAGPIFDMRLHSRDLKNQHHAWLDRQDRRHRSDLLDPGLVSATPADERDRAVSLQRPEAIR